MRRRESEERERGFDLVTHIIPLHLSNCPKVMHPPLPASPSLPIFVTGHPEHKRAERGETA